MECEHYSQRSGEPTIAQVPRIAVRLPAGHAPGSSSDTVVGQYVAVFPPRLNRKPAAFISNKCTGEPDRAEMTVNGAVGCVILPV